MSRAVRPWRYRGNASNATRGLIAIISGTALAQLVGLVSAPAISHLYSAEEYGTFAVLNSLGLTLGAVFAMRLELAIPLPDRGGVVRTLVQIAFVSIGAWLLVLVVVSLIIAGQAGELLQGTSVRSWLVLTPVLAASFCAFAVLNSLAVRDGRYGSIVRRNIVVALVMVGIQLGAGVVDGGVGALVAASVVAQLAGCVTLWARLPPADADGSVAYKMGRVLRRYRRFPIWLMPAGLLNVAGAHAPQLLIAGAYGIQPAGWFGMVARIVAIPAALLGQAAAQVYLGELARSLRERAGPSALPLFYRTSGLLALVAVPFTALAFFGGPFAISVLFADAWEPAGDMIRAYAVFGGFQLVASPLSQTLVVLERTLTQFSWDCGRLVVSVATLLGCSAFGVSATDAVWALSGAGCFMYALNWELCRRTCAWQGHESRRA